MPLIAAPAVKELEAKETSVSCALCCEDQPTLCQLTKCSHQGCGRCLLKWIEKVEASGQTKLPGCPFCRLELAAKDVEAIAGRPFQPRTTPVQPDAPTDDLTLQWLREQTKPCPGCGALIMKVETTCAKMECLCGYRFCYDCGSQDSQCSCAPSHHYFWDNVFDHLGPRQARPRANREQRTGLVNLKKHIAALKKKHAKEQQQLRTRQVQYERRNRRMVQERERRELDELFLSAKWLFCSKAEGLKMMGLLAQSTKVKQARRVRKLQAAKEIKEYNTDSLIGYSPKWLFCTKRGETRVLNQLLSSRVVRVARLTKLRTQTSNNRAQSDQATFASGRWLFGGVKGEMKRLRQLVNGPAVVERRRMTRAQIEQQHQVNRNRGRIQVRMETRWLFCKKSTTSIAVLRGQLAAQHKRAARLTTKSRRRTEAACGPDAVVFAPWLFLPRDRASRALDEIMSPGATTRVQARRLQRARAAVTATKQEMGVCRGKWLFECPSRQGTEAELAKVFRPHFAKSGTALTTEERKAIARRKGVCVGCGVKLFIVSVFKRKPLTNDKVRNGMCIKCGPPSC